MIKRLQSVKNLVQIHHQRFCKANNWDTEYDLKDNEIDNILLRGNKNQVQLSETEDEADGFKETEKIGRIKAISQEYQNQALNQEYKGENAVEIKYYKYGLAIPNIDPQFKGLDQILEEERLLIKTAHENVCELLKIDGQTSYDTYEKSLTDKYNHQEDMYGSIIDVSQNVEKTLERLGEAAVPMKTIEDENYMFYVRKYYSLNISLPGCIETENPNRFIRNLRPIEDFRHTPVIPVSDAEIKRWKDRMAEYHKNVFFFEIKKETIFNYFIFGCILYSGLFLIKIALDKQDEMGIAYQRLQLERIKYN